PPGTLPPAISSPQAPAIAATINRMMMPSRVIFFVSRAAPAGYPGADWMRRTRYLPTAPGGQTRHRSIRRSTMRASYLFTFVFLLAGVALGGPGDARKSDSLFQASTISALMAGVYDGDLTFGELRRHGDFGLGTLDALDGEMVAVDGGFYQVRADGRAYQVSEAARTPFAVVKWFHADRSLPIGEK